MNKALTRVLTATAAFVLAPVFVLAATLSFNPAIGTYQAGDTFTVSLIVTPDAGETITAVKVDLDFPADKLEVVSYTPTTGGNILAHVGTSHDNTAGKIIDNVAFNPGITEPTQIATITFKAKADGTAQVAVSSGAKLLDSNNQDKLASRTTATYTVQAQQEQQPQEPEPQPEPQTQPQPAPAPAPKPAPKPAATQQPTTTPTTTATTSTSTTTTTPTTTTTTQDQLAAAQEAAQQKGFNLKAAAIGALLLLLALIILLVAKRRKKEEQN